MKRDGGGRTVHDSSVTPRAGVWIETLLILFLRSWLSVTPRAGVWIETVIPIRPNIPSKVTPRAGVWIETKAFKARFARDPCHPPCGGVD